jgi:hypothetical protein
MTEKDKAPKTNQRYLIPRKDKVGMAVLDQEQFDRYLKEGTFKCGDEIIAARDGDEVIRVQFMEKYEIQKEGETCTLSCKE